MVIADASKISLERMVSAVEKVRQRLLRATAALKSANIPYAVAGGNAVAAWVSTIDEAAVRNTQDVDIVVRRTDFGLVKAALESAGFSHRHVAGIDAFLDGDGSKFRNAVHLLFSNEKVRPGDSQPNPDVTESTIASDMTVLTLEALVRNKLAVNRDKDRTHLRDMIGLGLIDATWPARLPPELAARLQHLLDTPEG